MGCDHIGVKKGRVKFTFTVYDEKGNCKGIHSVSFEVDEGYKIYRDYDGDCVIDR